MLNVLDCINEAGNSFCAAAKHLRLCAWPLEGQNCYKACGYCKGIIIIYTCTHKRIKWYTKVLGECNLPTNMISMLKRLCVRIWNPNWSFCFRPICKKYWYGWGMWLSDKKYVEWSQWSQWSNVGSKKWNLFCNISSRRNREIQFRLQNLFILRLVTFYCKLYYVFKYSVFLKNNSLIVVYLFLH